MGASSGRITAFGADWQLTKRKQEKAPTPIRAGAPPQMPAVRHFQGFVTGDNATLFPGSWTHSDAENPKKSVFARVSTDVIPVPIPILPRFQANLRLKLIEEYSSYFRKSVVVVCVAKRK